MQTDTETTFNQYMRSMADALREACRPGGHYGDAEGALRLARSIGPAVADIARRDSKLANKFIKSTYSGICVQCYGLTPPVGAKQWMDAVRKGYEQSSSRIREA